MKILGVDPSTNYLGLAFIEFDKDFKITNVKSITLNTIDLITPVFFPRQNFTYLYLYRYFCRLFETEPILYLGIESAFFNKFRITSYGPLTRVIEVIELAYLTTNKVNRINEYPPLTIKKRIGKEFFLNKEGTKSAILENKTLNKLIDKNMSEHEYDAMAIAYILYEDILANPEMLISL